MAAIVRTSITDVALDTHTICDAARSDRCGAVASFIGVVRNHDGGAAVAGITYSSHPSSPEVLENIAQSMADREGVHHIEAWHRIGHLAVGDDAMVIAVGAEHRGQAFAAVQAIVEEVKARLPIWKKQELTDGSHEWSGLP